VIRYGTDAGGAAAEREWWAGDLEARADGTRFELHVQGQEPTRVQIPMFGRFNVENALAALATLEAVGVPLAEATAALPQVRGVRRRQEIRGEVDGVTVIDDFAHHPTAVEASIGALKARYPGQRLIAVFEPRTNTSRRAIFQADYVKALRNADRVVVRAVPDEPIYSATGEVTERFSAAQLVDDLRTNDVCAECFDEVEEIVRHLSATGRPGDVVLSMSNGSFGNLCEKLLMALKG
jgi:UDP-N-acetylmuramate: L-alanyl-gamma-D-glutamyl-meso-diaminopimelate ligase